jgi:multidrug efflux pump subunit AcrA (membrane-fusion protein)
VTTHRLRPELHATPAEEAGVRFFDVSDPRSGQKMRMYDFEWLLAAQMDGHRSLEDIARWAEVELKLHLSAANLSAYADKLGELGFFALPEPAAPAPAHKQTLVGLSGSVTPLPPPSPAQSVEDDVVSTDDDIPLEVADPSSDEMATERHDSLPPRLPEPTRPPVAASLPPRIHEERTDPQRSMAAHEVTGSMTSASPAKKGSGSTIGLILVLLVVGGVIAYVTLFAPGGAKVSVQPAAISDVTSVYPGTATLGPAAAQKLLFEEAGKVSDIVASGTEVKAGMALATLDAYAKTEKDLADVKDRLGFYQKQLETAGQKGDVAAQKAADEKVSEKKKLLADLETRVQKLRIVATGPGVVGKVSAAAGADVKLGDPALELTSKRTVATFHVPAGTDLKPGADVMLQTLPNAPTVAGRVVSRDGDNVTVEAIDSSAIKTGAEVHLAKSKLTGVVAVPASAISSQGGADSVFVLADGQVHARPVKIAEKSGADVYIASGLHAGEEVVTRGVDALKDGDKATADKAE